MVVALVRWLNWDAVIKILTEKSRTGTRGKCPIVSLCWIIRERDERKMSFLKRVDTLKYS
jgi:hypothetical protein